MRKWNPQFVPTCLWQSVGPSFNVWTRLGFVNVLFTWLGQLPVTLVQYLVQSVGLLATHLQSTMRRANTLCDMFDISVHNRYT